MTIALANAPIADRAVPAPEAVVMRFAGDSGDGIQLTGGQFTLSTALAGNDLATFPDFPAEIRAPQGTTFGVSAFQINFGSTLINTVGDAPDVLMAMNPAALKVNLAALRIGGLIIADSGAFDERNLEKAGYGSNPLEDVSLAPYQLFAFDITRLTLEAVKPLGLSNREAHRCKAMWALGLALWMFDRDRRPLIEALQTKFGAKGDKLVEANIAALNAGHAYGETAEIGRPLKQFRVPPANMRARFIPHRDGRRDDRARLGGRKPTRRPSDILGLLSDHAGEPHPAQSGETKRIQRHKFPGRRRDCGDLLGHRRLLCRPHRRHIVFGPRRRSQERSAWPRHHVRTAAGRGQRPARWPINRIADQDRTVRPVSGSLRPQRRCPAGRPSRAQPFRLL